MNSYSTIGSTLDEWKATRALLATTIQSYRDACAALCNVSLFPANWPCKRTLLEDLFATIDSELESLVEEEDILCGARVSLAAARNRFFTLAPVNTLPPEILSKIFLHSKGLRCVCDERRFQIAGVCTYWRQIATNTPDLWTHVDIVPGSFVNLTKLLLERTKDVPIYLHLCEPRFTIVCESLLQYYAQCVTTMLKPHIHRVRDLKLETRSSFHVVVGAIVNLWLTSGSPNLARLLSIFQPHTQMALSYADQSEGATTINQSENAKNMLRSLSMLHLQNVRLDWNSGAFRGLSQLRLTAPSHREITISISQFSDILAANPALEMLELGNMRIVPRLEDSDHLSPILLRSLDTLSLLNLENDDLRLILPLISLPTSPPEFSILFTSANPIHSVLSDFLVRSKATFLLCSNTSFNGPLTWLPVLRSLPHLSELIIENSYFPDEPPTEANWVSPLAYPASVTLSNCAITFGGLNIFIARHGIQNLKLQQCRELPDSHGGLENMKIALLNMHPGLNCTVTNVLWAYDPVHRSPWDVLA
ncbi:hypothetical protein FRC12_011800 [Ceratobasidium sp. 428]|nr:hypothetical protein FRC12_011800 [Ceratobasidium sp. 428]